MFLMRALPMGALIFVAAAMQAQVTAYPGSACQGKEGVAPEGDGRSSVSGRLGGQSYEVVCPLVTRGGEHSASVKIHLATYLGNECSIKTIAEGGGLILTSSASFSVPGHWRPLGIIPIKEERQLAISHANTAQDGDVRIVVCRLPHVNRDITEQLIRPDLRTYSLEEGVPGLTLAEHLDRFRERLQAEVRDDAWATGMEEALQEIGSNHEGLELESLDCRETICQVIMVGAADAVDAFEAAAASVATPKSRELFRERLEGDGQSVALYLTR